MVEEAAGVVEHLARVRAPLDQVVAGLVDVVHHEVQARAEPEWAVVTPSPKIPGRRQLHDPEAGLAGQVRVEPPWRCCIVGKTGAVDCCVVLFRW